MVHQNSQSKPPEPKMKAGAVAPRESHETPTRRGETSESLGYMPGASASSSAVSASLKQTPTPPTVPAPPIPTEASLRLYSQRKMPQYLQKEIAPHVSVRCGVKFALVPSGLTLQILSNGQPEILQSLALPCLQREAPLWRAWYSACALEQASRSPYRAPCIRRP